MFTKTLFAALVVLGLAAQANAGPQAPSTEHSYIDRASANFDGGGY